MHNAPAVSAIATRCRSVFSLLLIVICASVAVAVVVGQSSISSIAPLALPAFSLCIAAASIYGWLTSPVGRLTWDGQHWSWSGFPDEPECELALHVDFQWCVLLRLRNGRGASTWLFLQHKNNSAIWFPLRRALCAGTEDTP
jgi:hypothetical protein